MKKIFQNDTSEIGNCFSACIASLIELPLHLIPHFRARHGKEMVIAARKWLQSEFNLYLVGVPAHKAICPATPCIGVVPSQNYPGEYHAVVGTWDGKDFVTTHDPNPNNTPNGFRAERLYFIVPGHLAVAADEIKRLESVYE